jgi:hypothetical protein
MRALIRSVNVTGKDYLFEQCPLENQLRAFVVEQHMLGASVSDGQLQNYMCDIVRAMERSSVTPSDTFANWIVKGIYSGSGWLLSFKQRAGIHEPIDASESGPSTDAMHEWPTSVQYPTTAPAEKETIIPIGDASTIHEPLNDLGDATTEAMLATAGFNMYVPPKGLLPDDFNFFRIFESDIKRWVAATMSPRNPNCHVPSDEEIQHQARWIMYGGDDAWNQTPADFPEWLWRFKRDVGILEDNHATNPTNFDTT